MAALADSALLHGAIDDAVTLMSQVFRDGGKVLFCGNGGSAADAQHFAAELSGRFLLDRAPLPAEALHTNASFLTAVANDYDYTQVFARALEASARPGDVLVAISTSGRSPNVVRAAERAADLGVRVIAMTGEAPCPLARYADVWLSMPSRTTPRVQECHVAVLHAISERVEHALFAAPDQREHGDP